MSRWFDVTKKRWSGAAWVLALVFALFLILPLRKSERDSNDEPGSIGVHGTTVQPPESGQPSQLEDNVSSNADIGLRARELRFETLECIDLAEINEAGEHSHVVASWRGRFSERVDQSLLEGKRQGEVRVSLPDGGWVTAEFEAFERFGEGRGVYMGRLAGVDHSQVVLSYVGEAVSGSLRNFDTNEVWEIRNAGAGQQFLEKVDVSAIGVCGLCREMAFVK